MGGCVWVGTCGWVGGRLVGGGGGGERVPGRIRSDALVWRSGEHGANAARVEQFLLSYVLSLENPYKTA